MSLSPPVSTQTNQPIRCLVIQLARLGDTLQTLMALRAAQQLYPQLEIHLMARERFADAVKRVPWIKEVIVLPTDEILGPILSGQGTQAEGIRGLARWLAPLVRQPWDIVLNWTFSEASSYITGLMPARVKVGYSRRRDLTLSTADGWSSFIQGAVQGGVRQNIHLTDILTTQLLTTLQIHVGDPQTDGNSPVTSKSFFNLELGERDPVERWKDVSKKWVAFQLGAGHPSKIWPAANWAEFAELILTQSPETNIVLLGGAADLPASREIMARVQQIPGGAKRVLPLTGETDFDLWASVTSRCQWLIAGDTAAIHLASVLGTRVLNLSLGPVRWEETGPYGNGHYVVAPNEQGGPIPPRSAYGAWSYASHEWSHRRQTSISKHFEDQGLRDALDSIRVFHSKIRSTSDGGGVTYEPMNKPHVDLDTWMGMVVGHTARAWYCGWTPTVAKELDRAMIGPGLVKELRRLEESSELLSKVCDEAVKTASLLNSRSKTLRSDRVMRLGDRDELRDLGKKLMELDALIERLGKAHSPLRFFSQMGKVMMHNLSGENLAELGRESAESYKLIGEGVGILREWLKTTLSKSRPAVVQGDRIASVERLH